MGTILGDLLKNVGKGIDKVFNGEIIDGIEDVLIGAGDAVSRMWNGTLNIVGLGDEQLDPRTRLVLGEVALLAKMAKADGRVDRSEIDFVKSLFDEWGLEPDTRTTFQHFFNEQKQNGPDAAEWAQSVLQAAIELDPGDDSGGFDIRLQIYRHLFMMALADGEIDDAEVALLRAIPDPLGFKPEVFDLVVAEFAGGDEDEGASGDSSLAQAYSTLGISPDASDAEVKTAWKRKLAAFHPDKIQGKDLDPEWLELANQKSAEINQAYETIKAARE